MTELYALIKSFSKEELTAVKLSFKRSVRIEKEGNLLGQLFRMLTVNKERFPSDKTLSKALYDAQKIPALAKLKSRLFQYMLEVIVSDNLLCRENLYDPTDRAMIRLRKKMVYFRALYRKINRADMSVILHLMNEIISEARELEQYDMLIDALYYKKYFYMVRKGFDEVHQTKKQIEIYERTYKALLNTNDHYFNLITNQDMVRNMPPQEFNKMLKIAVKETEEAAEITDSGLIKYAYKILKLNDLTRSGKHSDTMKICQDLLDLVEEHPNLYRRERVAFIYDNMCLCKVLNGNMEEAMVYVKKAQDLYSRQSINYMFSKEQEFYVLFYSGEYKSAELVVDELLNFPIINSGEYRHDKFSFLKACTHFQLGDYKKARSICGKTLKITKDKGRWDIGIRYLSLMCMIEMEDLDDAHNAVETLRKCTKLEHQHGVLTKRDEWIYKCFREYSHCSFSNTPNTKLKNYLDRLNEPGELAWEFYTHELIPTHDWMKKKLVKNR